MPHALSNLTLKSLLTIDAATCALMGAGLLVASQPLAAALAMPAALLLWAGAALLPTAAFMAISAMASPTPRWAAGVILAGNALWAVASLLAPAVGGFSPNALGWAFLVAQAAAVAVLTKLEYDAAACFTGREPTEPRAERRGA